MSVRRAASLPALSVHLRIVPRPTNLSESREIFRVLQRYGEISVFKYLRVCTCFYSFMSASTALGADQFLHSTNTTTPPRTLPSPSSVTRPRHRKPSMPRPFASPSKRSSTSSTTTKAHPPTLLPTPKTKIATSSPPPILPKPASTRSCGPPPFPLAPNLPPSPSEPRPKAASRHPCPSTRPRHSPIRPNP
jgi:hypothetical protein